MSIERDMAFIHVKSFLQTVEKMDKDDTIREMAAYALEKLERLRETD